MFTSFAMREVDARTMAAGVSGETLMGRAALGLAEEMCFLMDGKPHPVIVLAGPGNNGGDGWGLAFQLKRLGWPVEVWAAMARERVGGDAAVFLQAAEGAGVICRWLPEEADWQDAERYLLPDALLVDALLGTGVKNAPHVAVAAAVRFLRTQRRAHRVIAVDVPTGLNPDRGEPFDPDKCVKADFTLTLGGAKTGFEKDSSAVWTGSVSVVDLDLPAEMLCELSEGAWQVLNLAQAREWLGARPRDAHKGTFGHVSLIGGSPGMTGAIRMAARAALHTGSGLVTVLTPQTCATVVSVDTPEIMVYGGKVGQYGTLCSQPFAVRGSTAVLIGPGMGVDYDTRDLTDRVVEGTQVPLVLDADALRNLPNLLNGLSGKPSTRYLTPHPGEMGFLLQTSPDEVQADRSAAVRALHQQMGAHAVLKGSRSRMLTAGGEGWLNLNGNPGMATAGAGDVLSGMVVSLAGQGLAAEAVLPLATYLHGKAGDLASMRKGQAGMRAGDIVDAIPAVMRRVCGR